MATARTRSPIPVVQIALVALWIGLAALVSGMALHFSAAAVRLGDLELASDAGGLARMAAGMAERGVAASEIASAVAAAAKTRGLAVTVHARPPDAPPPASGAPHEPRERPADRVDVLVPPPDMMDPGLLARTPMVMVRAGDSMLMLGLPGDPVGGIWRDWIAAMLALAAVALAATWYVDARLADRLLAPSRTIEAALRRLAAGERTHLEVVGHGQADAAVVSAFNDAADELAASIRLRAEAESNLRLFVADAGHELRTPLTVIMGFLDVLRHGAVDERAVAARILDSMAAEGERMRLLISKLLQLARLDSVAPDRRERVDLGRVAAGVVESFRAIAGATTLRVDAAADVVVAGAATEVHELAGILLDNALKYAAGSHVTATVAREGDRGVLTVADDGPGMAPDVVARAFERFSRGDERGAIPGAGLGLAIVKRIADRAGGDASIESALGSGTTVRVRLPLAAD